MELPQEYTNRNVWRTINSAFFYMGVKLKKRLMLNDDRVLRKVFLHMRK